MYISKPYKQVCIEVSARCNIKCIMCPVPFGFTESGMMSDEVFESILHYLEGVSCIHFTGSGEPFLDRKIFAKIKEIKKYGCKVSITTHGGFLNEQTIPEIFKYGLDIVRISFHGATKKTYEEIKVGSNYDKVLENVKRLIYERKRRESVLKVCFNYSVMKKNIKEIPILCNLANDLGIDEVAFTGLFAFDLLNTTSEKCDERELLEEIYIARAKLNGKLYTYNIEKNDIPIHCPQRAEEMLYIIYNGDVYPCCHLPYEKVYTEDGQEILKKGKPVGNVLQEPLSQIWEKEEYARFRKMWENSIIPEDCTNCQLIKGFQRTAGSVEV